MGSRQLRPDIPINLPDTFKEEARELRNKLLLYRFHRRAEIKLDSSLVDPRLEPRLNQILLPLLSVASDEGVRADLRSPASPNATASSTTGRSRIGGSGESCGNGSTSGATRAMVCTSSPPAKGRRSSCCAAD